LDAGWYGLAAAKQYRYTRPDDSLAIFESQSSLGGTWADERLYPDLKSNNLLGTYEYPDFPMDSERFGIKPGQYISGDIINTYLKAYASHFGIDNLVRLHSKVLAAEHHDDAGGGWTLTVAGSDGESQVFTRRLVIATGLTSEPFLPRFEGQDSFGGPIFHGKHFLQNRATLETAKDVTIFGATKFSWDAVYSYAQAGVKVNWVIRCEALSRQRSMPDVEHCADLTSINSVRPWPVLDCPVIRHAAEAMDRETRKYVRMAPNTSRSRRLSGMLNGKSRHALFNLVQPLHMG